MRSRELAVLLRKDLAELFASRAFWLLLLVIGPLAGQSFRAAAASYEEMSGIGGGPAALAQGLSPLDGVLSPVMGAYDLAIMLLFPFVAIRLLASEKSSDALKLMLQWPVSRRDIVFSKVVTLMFAWLFSLVAFALALAVWRANDGHVFIPETLNLIGGYTLRFLFTACISLAAAAIMPGAANAAIVVLAFTIGTWALDFVAAGRGGLLAKFGAYTPTAILRDFERGLLRIDVVIVWLVIAAAAAITAELWLNYGASTQRKIRQTIVLVIVAAFAAVIASTIPTTFDVSENRRNSFSESDQRALATIREPLTITVWLAAEDPRMADFSNNVLVKLRRALPHVEIVYPLEGRSGLFENNDRYGEIEYRLRTRTAMSRSTTEEIVLDAIYGLAGIVSPQHNAPAYAGYPLQRRIVGASFVFYGLWPLSVVLLWWMRGARRNRQTG